MMLQGFADESEGKIVSLTGCILPYPEWVTFTEHWVATLAETPAISHFHMREARSLKGPFAGWNAMKRDLKIIRLVSVLMGHRPHVITAWLTAENFSMILKPNSTYESKHCYFPCFHALLLKAAAYNRQRGVHLPTDFIFDEKGDIGDAAARWYRWVISAADDSLKPYFGATPIFRDDLQVLPLQAADLIGWHTHRKLEVPGHDIERVPTERLDDLPMVDVELDKDFLEEIAAQFGEVFSEMYPTAELMRIKPSERAKMIRKLKKRVAKIAKDDMTSEYET